MNRHEIQSLENDASVAKVCTVCKAVTLVRVVKPGKGLYDVAAQKCEDCGSEATYVAFTKREVPFKERIKR